MKELQIFVNDELWMLNVSDAESVAATTGSKYYREKLSL